MAQKLPEDPTSLQAQVLNNLALLYRQQGKRELALTTFSQAYSVIRSHSGEGHPELFHPLKNIAILQAAAGDTAAALSSIESAIRIGENGLGPNHPAIGSALELHADLLRRCKRTKEARALTARAMAIRRLNQTNDLSRYTLDVRDRKQLSR